MTSDAFDGYFESHFDEASQRATIGVCGHKPSHPVNATVRHDRIIFSCVQKDPLQWALIQPDPVLLPTNSATGASVKGTRTVFVQRIAIWKNSRDHKEARGQTGVIFVPRIDDGGGAVTPTDDDASAREAADTEENSARVDIFQRGRGELVGPPTERGRSGSTRSSDSDGINVISQGIEAIGVQRKRSLRPLPSDRRAAGLSEPATASRYPIFYYDNETDKVKLFNMFHVSLTTIIHGAAFAINASSIGLAAYRGDGEGVWKGITSSLGQHLPPVLAHATPNAQNLLGQLLKHKAQPTIPRQPFRAPASTNSNATDALKESLEQTDRTCEPAKLSR